MVDSSMDAREWARKQLEEADPDLLRALMQTVLADLMGTEIDQICGASYGERSEIRENSRNGYRSRRFDTRVGTMDLPIPKLRSGSYFPDWLLERQKRAEKALISIVADAYLAGVSTRRVDKLVKQLGIEDASRGSSSFKMAHLGYIGRSSRGPRIHAWGKPVRA